MSIVSNDTWKLFNLSSSHPGGTFRSTGIQNLEGDTFGRVLDRLGTGLGAGWPKELDRGLAVAMFAS